MKKVIGSLMGIVLNLYITLGSMAMFMTLILPNHEHGMFLHLFVSSKERTNTKRNEISFVEQWFLVFLEEVLYILCLLYSEVFCSLCSNCEWQFALHLALL